MKEVRELNADQLRQLSDEQMDAYVRKMVHRARLMKKAHYAAIRKRVMERFSKTLAYLGRGA